jgi:hypothetical protein
MKMEERKENELRVLLNREQHLKHEISMRSQVLLS